jgi:hypothetical protein
MFILTMPRSWVVSPVLAGPQAAHYLLHILKGHAEDIAAAQRGCSRAWRD